MNIPLISYYALFAETTAAGRKTPKYTIVKSAGYYPPMAKLTGRDGAPDKPCGVGRADANPKLLLNDT